MSTFKLDFDISGLRVPPERPPQRRRFPVRAKQEPVLPVLAVHAEKPKTEPEPPQTERGFHIWVLETFNSSSLKLLLKSILVLTLIISVVTFVLVEGSLYAQENKPFEGSCESRSESNYLLCHGSRGCNVRGNCHNSRLVHFSSKKCAGQVQTITTHSPEGDATQYPAHYLHYKNTSDFIVEGDRVLFHPVNEVACSATVRALPDNQFSREVLSQLRGSILWVSDKIYDKFIVQRDNHTLATVEEDIALFTSTSYYRLYKLDFACSTKYRGPVVVYGEEAASQHQTPINAFDFC